MAKLRKTRAEKIRTQTPTFEFVKREFNRENTLTHEYARGSKSREFSSQIADLASVKKDLVKTFALASIIFAAELVLYLWSSNFLEI